MEGMSNERDIAINNAEHAGGTNRCRNGGFAAVTEIEIIGHPTSLFILTAYLPSV
jgi:hypothetical protein